MRILVTGATGFVGRHLIRALHEAGHKVIGSARGTADVSPIGMRYGWMPSDFNEDIQKDIWVRRIHGQGIDAMVNTVGILRESNGQEFQKVHEETPMALFAAAYQCGVKQIIQISALGNGDSRYYQTKYAADKYLSELEGKWTVLRPSVIYGEQGDSTRLFKWMAKLPLIPLVANGDQLIQPIHVNELTKIIVNLIQLPPKKNEVLEIVGPKPIQFRDFLANIRLGVGKGKARFISVPKSLVQFVASAGDALNIPSISRESLSMLVNGNTADPDKTIKVLGVKPKRVKEFFTVN